MVIDPVMELEVPKDAYERLFDKVDVHEKYTKQEMVHEMLKNKHWGPWSE